MKKRAKNTKKLLIVDCDEDNYHLYSKIYKQIAKFNGFSLEKTFVLTDKKIHSLTKSDGCLISFSNDNADVCVLCNAYKIPYLFTLSEAKRIPPNRVCLFEYYTSLFNVSENPITAAMSVGACRGTIYGISTNKPSKNYKEELTNILYNFLIKGLTVS